MNTAQVFAEESRFIGEPIDTIPPILAAFGHRDEDDVPTDLGGAELERGPLDDEQEHEGKKESTEDTPMEDWTESRRGHDEVVKFGDLHDDDGPKRSDSFDEDELKNVALRKRMY